ncbi:MAG: glutathione S-transferase, partial [Rhodospirillales bacterium]|nr:glutathione S-transferase [Rhodospirillales bacterium]
MEIQLYYAPNTCALAPYITLTEAGGEFETEALNFRWQQNKSPEYLKLNPKHKVPLLVVDGEALTKSTAIQMWIARNFQDANLLPADPWQELKAISMLSWCSSGIHPYLSRINSPVKVCDLEGAGEAVCRQAKGFLLETFGIADDMLAGR